MKDDFSDLDETTAYRMRAMHGTITAVIQAGAIKGSPGGVVKLDVALEGICDAIAALESAAGVSQNSRERRQTADLCRGRTIKTNAALAKAAEDGKPLPWKFETIGEPS
ncbi:MAG TPA: hypothetical protein VF637_07900 [Sphingomicrobium sp.]